LPRLRVPGGLWLACWIVAMGGKSLAQPTNSGWVARVWQSDDGLPNNDVSGLAQSADGYLWVANPARLARFDGVHFEDYSSAAVMKPYNNRITAVLQSRRGGLWLAMDHGPVAYLSAGSEVLVTNGLPDLGVLGIEEDSEGAAWVSYRSGPVCRVRNGVATQFLTNSATGASGSSYLAADEQGQVWAVKGRMVSRFNGTDFTPLLMLNSNTPARIARARGGGVWVCQEPKLSMISEDGTEHEVPMSAAATEELTGMEPTCLMEDADGGLWIGTTDGGLFRYKGGEVQSVATSHRTINCLAQDREGNIWVGTEGGGLDRLEPQPVVLEGTESGLPVEMVQSICEDTGGVIWAVTQNSVLVRRTGSQWTRVSGGSGWPGGKPMCVAADQTGGVWIGAEGHLLYCLRGGNYTAWHQADGLKGRYVRSLLASKAGDVWIAEAGPESLLRLRNGKIQNLKVPENAGVFRAMTEDRNGNIWVGTSKHVLLKATGDEVTDVAAKIEPHPSAIRSLLATPDGTLWLGYAGRGVGRYKNGHYTGFSTDEGMYDNFVSQIVADGRGWIWFGADHGIFKVREEDFDDVAEGRATEVRPVHYGESAGLPSLQASFGNSPGTLLSHDGRLWMPMMSALAVADPDKLREAGPPPPVLLRQVSVDGETEAMYGGALPVPTGLALEKPGATLRLPPNHHHVEFEFTALSFTAPENVRFRYRLEGFDDGWVDSKGSRVASYSRLPAGNYRFQVRACNGDGVWGQTSAAIGFSVAPFLWQKWWFRLGGAATFTALVLGIARLLEARRMRERVLELERRSELERSRMAGMAEVATSVLHNVGNVLNSVNISTTVIARKARDLRIDKVGKVSELLNAHAGDLANFMANDPKGRRVPEYLTDLSGHLERERDEILDEVRSLANGVEHIKNIVARQQSYARASGVQESFEAAEVVDDAIRIHSEAMENLQVKVLRDYEKLPPVTSDKHKILQIVINLIANAKHALTEGGVADKRLEVHVGKNGDGNVKISVTDNGVGIRPENLTQIFQYGFTTRKDGHGFGLHSGALAAKELGGSLTVQSEGPGKGATFTLEFPLEPTQN
jgi:ligand-binding sensor domain-containing protein/signal transduction histidine kinase